MFTNRKIAFIGAGVMGTAMMIALIREGIVAADALAAADPLTDHLDELAQKYQIKGGVDNATAVKDADVVVLSVKPQQLDKVFASLQGKLEPDALVLSIVAGATLEKISSGLLHSCVIRAMPNTPAQIGAGITVWTAAELVSDEQREMARRILCSFGEEIFIADEAYLDAATALSGTGPAYVFLFMEAMVDAGVHLGFQRNIAERLVSQTVLGSAQYYLKCMENDQVHLAALRNQVTSPAGTSAAALYYLEKAGFRTAISRSIWAAYERSRELGEGKKTRSPERSQKSD